MPHHRLFSAESPHGLPPSQHMDDSVLKEAVAESDPEGDEDKIDGIVVGVTAGLEGEIP